MSNKNIELYVSLSSIPGREKYLIDTLKSLVNQNVKPKLIIINLCENYKRFKDEKYNFKYINKEKKFFKNNKILININYSNDYGPVTKLFGCLNKINKCKDKIQYIVVVDDDLIYRNNMLEKILKKIKKDSSKCYSFCVDKIDNMKIGKGADSFSLNVNFLDDIILYYDLILKDNSLWFYHDDFIISSYLFLKNIDICDLRKEYNLKNNIYVLNGNINKRALHNLEGNKSPENLNKKLRESYNKLLANNSFEFLRNK